MNKIKKYLLKKWLKNYYALYDNGKTPPNQDIAKAIWIDLHNPEVDVYSPLDTSKLLDRPI